MKDSFLFLSRLQSVLQGLSYYRCRLLTKMAIISALLFVSFDAYAEDFDIYKNGIAADIYIDKDDWKGAVRAAGDLSSDIEKVTGKVAVLNPISSFSKKELAE